MSEHLFGPCFHCFPFRTLHAALNEMEEDRWPFRFGPLRLDYLESQRFYISHELLSGNVGRYYSVLASLEGLVIFANELLLNQYDVWACAG